MKRKDFSKLKITTQTEKISHFEHEDFIAGVPPFLRGIKTTNKLQKPIKLLQNFKFISSEEKEIHKNNLDNNTINTIEDINRVLNEIIANKTPVYIAEDEQILPFLAFLIVAAENQKIDKELLTITLQNDILSVLLNNDNLNYSLKNTLKISSDIFEYTCKYLPNLTPIVISGLPNNSDNTTPENEIAYAFSKGLTYLKAGISKGISIDSLAPKLVFNWSIGTDYFLEIAKLRAARMLWANIIKQFNPKNLESLAMRSNCQINDKNTAKETIKTMCAIIGGAESISIPNYFSTKINNSFLYNIEETGCNLTIDPWAGSTYIETKTEEITNNAWQLFENIENSGGITSIINKKQVQSDFATKKTTINNLSFVDLRDNAEVKLALSKIANCIKTNEGNLLNLSIEAVKKGATLSELQHILTS